MKGQTSLYLGVLFVGTFLLCVRGNNSSGPTGKLVATLTVLNSTALNVSWTKLDDNDANGKILNYTVYYSTKEGELNTSSKSTTVTGEDNLFVLLTKLNEATEYFVAVLATNSAASGPLSEVVSVKTKEAKPSKGPDIDKLISKSATSLTVTWKTLSFDEANGVITNYTICYNKTGLKDETCNETNANEPLAFTIEDLNEATYYEVFIRANNSKGYSPKGNSTGEKTMEAAPSQGPNATVLTITSTTLKVLWTKLSHDIANGDILYYTVHYRKEKFNDTASTMNIIYGKDNTSAVLTGLNEATKYYVAIVATNSNGSSPLGHLASNTTLEAAPSQGPNATVLTITSTTLKVLWTKLSHDIANGDILNYTVHYRKEKFNDTASTMNIIYGKDTTSAVLTGLNEATKYYVAIVATNSNGSSPLGHLASNTTFEAAPSQGPNATVLTITSTTLKVLWTKLSHDLANGDIHNYTVHYQSKKFYDTASTINKIFGKNTTSAVLTGLSPATEYFVAIVATNSKGSSPLGQLANNTTFEAGPSQGPNATVLTISSTALKVLWTELNHDVANGEILTYTVHYQNKEFDDVDSTMKITYGKVTTSAVLTGLNEATKYYVAVIATNSKDSSPLGQLASNTTFEAAPSRGPNITMFDDTKATKIKVNWRNLSHNDANGEIIEYGVCYKTFHPKGDIKDCLMSQNTSNGKTLSLTIDRLLPATQYVFAVRAKTSIGYGPVGKPTNIMTFDGIPPAPSIILCEPSLLRIKMEWNASMVNGTIKKYKICWELCHELSETQYEIKGLKPGKKYTVKVQAYTNASPPGPEATKTVETSKSDIQPNTTLEVVGVQDDQIQVGIKLPSVNQAEEKLIIYYQVLVKKWEENDDINFRKIDKIEDYPSSFGGQYKAYVAFASKGYQGGAKVVIGNGKTSIGARRKRSTNTAYNNALLTEDTTYAIFVRVFYDESQTYSSSKVLKVTTESERNGAPTAVIILVIVLVIVAFLVVVFGVLLLRRRKRGNNYGQDVPLTPVTKVVRNPISVEDFRAHCDRLSGNSGLGYQEEYESISPKVKVSSEIAKRPENIDKNRYNNIHAYDDSRVVLPEIEDEKGSDYINANYIDGFNRKKQFIASQGPIKSTVEDFWRMIWEKGVTSMVMVANPVEKGKEKCAIYWPQEKAVKHGAFTIKMDGHEVELADYIIRKMIIIKDNEKEERRVTQFHYTVWPDHGVPAYSTSLQAFLTRVRKSVQNESHPLLVHCSAGVGRTGTFIGIFAMMDRIETNKDIDIYNFVCQMRGQRTFMVQVESQYVFLHKAVLEAVECGDTEVSATDLRVKLYALNKPDPDNEKQTLMEKQFQVLDKYTYKKTNTQEGKHTYNANKNRNSDLLPYEDTRVNLLRSPGVEGSDYINASFIDSYQKRGMYIATQFPLENTANDFWRMVWEKKSNCIVMLVNLANESEMYDKYWTEKNNDAMLCGNILVTLENEVKNEEFIVRTFKIKKNDGGETRTISHFNFLSWAEDEVPKATVGILKMIGQIQEIQRQCGNNLIVVHCSDGGGRTGAFCALVTSLERVKQDQTFNLFQTIMLQRIQRPMMVSSVDQYKLCFKAIIDFLDSFDDYANFAALTSK